jgi:hypothetical protein
MINIIIDLVILLFSKIFTWLGQNLLYIILDITVFLFVFIWLCDIYAKKEAAQLEKYRNDRDNEERKIREEREYQERQKRLPR